MVSLADTVSKPLELILVPDITEPVPAVFELTVHVTPVPGLLVPVTVALNCCVLPLVIVCDEGLTVTLVTVGAGAFTVIVALPDFEVSTAEVAIT